MIKIVPLYSNLGINSKNSVIKQSQNPVNVEDSDKLSNDLNQLSAIAKSQVNFRGGKFKFHKYDLMFIGSLVTTFGLSAAMYDKLKDVVGNFLKENNCTSLSDIGGEEDVNINKQCDLSERINNVLNLSNEDRSLLMDKIIDRCDTEFGYDPDYVEEDPIADILIDHLKNLASKRKENDKKLINAISLTFDFTSEQKAELEKIIQDTLKENTLGSLKELGDEDKTMEMTELVNTIAEKFNLDMEHKDLLIEEFIRRAFSNEDTYKPMINPLDRNIGKSAEDAAAINKMLSKYNFKPYEADDLIIAMKNDAYNLGLTSVLDLFQKGCNVNSYQATNKVLNSRNFADKKVDIIIDLFDCASNLDNITNQIKAENNEKPSIFNKNCAAMCMLDDTFNFSKKDLINLKAYFMTLSPDITKEKDFWKVVYEICELFNLQSDNVEKAIRKANEFSEDELTDYQFKLAQKIIDKK